MHPIPSYFLISGNYIKSGYNVFHVAETCAPLTVNFATSFNNSDNTFNVVANRFNKSANGFNLSANTFNKYAGYSDSCAKAFEKSAGSFNFSASTFYEVASVIENCAVSFEALKPLAPVSKTLKHSSSFPALKIPHLNPFIFSSKTFFH